MLLATHFLFIGKQHNMKTLKIFLFSIIFLLMSCGTIKETTSQKWAEIGLDGYMITTFDKTLNGVQLDSLCRAENIASDLEEWVKMSLYNQENKTQVTQYLFIKVNDAETLYTIQDQFNGLYYVTIRRIREDNEK